MAQDAPAGGNVVPPIAAVWMLIGMEMSIAPPFATVFAPATVIPG
jgi:hypothetical protein